MKDKDLELIKELMDQLQGEMQYGKDDFEQRLGRKKPELEPEVMGEPEEQEEDELLPKVKPLEEMPDEEMQMDEENPEQMDMQLGEEMEEKLSPEEELKKRLLKLRG